MKRCLIIALFSTIMACAIAFLAMGSFQIKHSNEIQKTVCTINQTVLWSYEDQNDNIHDCATITLNATICGNIGARTTFIVCSKSSEEIQKEYPLGSSVDCWVNTNNCSIYSEADKPELAFGIVLLLLSLFMIGGVAFLAYLLCCSRSAEEERILTNN